MNEMFRFAVVRPADVSRSSTTPLSPRGSLSTELQQHLGAITQGSEGDASTVWAELEKMCVPYVRNNAGHVLAEPLWKSLGAFPDAVRANVAAWHALPVHTTAIASSTTSGRSKATP